MLYQNNRNRNTLTLTSLVLAALIYFPPLQAQEEKEGPKVLDEIVAKINNEIVTLTDLNQSLAERRSELRQELEDPTKAEQRFAAEKPYILKNLIQTKLMLQKASELGMDADMDSEVAGFLENMRQDLGIPTLEVMDQYLRQRGGSLQKFRQRVKENLITQSLIRNLVYSKITLLTPEVEAFYKENEEAFTVPAKVDLAEILFLTEGKDKSEVRHRAEEALRRLQSGDSFEELAKEYSEGPTAAKGGQIGSFNRGSMNEKLEDIAFRLDIGSTSEIIESDFGFQIIKVLDRVEASLKPLDEVRPQIAEALYQKKAQPQIEEFLRELIHDSYIFVSSKYTDQYNLEGLI